MRVRYWAYSQVLPNDYGCAQISSGNDLLSVCPEGFNEVGGHPPDLSIIAPNNPINGSSVRFLGRFKGSRMDFVVFNLEVTLIVDKPADRFFRLDVGRQVVKLCENTEQESPEPY